MSQNAAPKSIQSNLKAFLADRFDLSQGKAKEEETVLEIKQNIVFKGANLWILIFAIMVASVGLDTNNTAVVIGAMLISPLMGPIMGVGLGLGTNDFDIIVQSVKNWGIAVLISILTSAFYFWVSPLNEAQSELLSRTAPTLWDVLIALFGGFAGIVAGSRAEKSNAIPGVAIATALMPPLCTAGFGLATGQWNYFFGACYLFWINSAFIALATYVVVRLLRFKPKEFIDPKRERRVRRYVGLFLLVTLIPSVYTAIEVVRESLFKRNANEFIARELSFENSQVINRHLVYSRKGSHIDVTLYGQPISDEMINRITLRMPNYHLEECSLDIIQDFQQEAGIDVTTIELLNERIRAGIIEDLYRRNENQIKNRDDRIKLLEKEIIDYRSRDINTLDLIEEIKVIDQNVAAISVSPAFVTNIDSLSTDTLYLVYVNFHKKPTTKETQHLENWLQARIKTEKIKIVQD
ncbi:MAG: TIGR00341 family protein [Saprospiraceae bacterium]|nr:TIGR00341 family protein [Saprospiraceae bacterium]